MTEHDPLLGIPPSEEEVKEAHHLAEALESGASGGADPRALSVVHLIKSLSESSPDGGFARIRTRRALVARASRARPLRIASRIAAVAALAVSVLSGALLWRSSVRPSARLLDQREAAAREAVAAIALSGTGDSKGVRLRAQLDDLRVERFASALRSERMEALLGQIEETSSTKNGLGNSQPSTSTQDAGGAL